MLHPRTDHLALGLSLFLAACAASSGGLFDPGGGGAGGKGGSGGSAGHAGSGATGGNGGAAGSAGAGGVAGNGGSGGGSTAGGCADPSLTCTDGSGQGDYACFDPNSSSGYPSSAPMCQQQSDCQGGYSCWGDPGASTGYCLQDCAAGGTGGVGGGSGGSAGSAGAGGSGGCGATVTLSSIAGSFSNCGTHHHNFSGTSGLYNFLMTYGSNCGDLVVPGDVANSSIVQVVTGSSCGSKMPSLPAATLTALKAWICEGAQNN